MKYLLVIGVCVASVLSIFPALAIAQGEKIAATSKGRPTYATALLSFQSAQPELKEAASKVDSLLYALLSTKDSLLLVEREEIDKVLSETELGLSGAVDAGTAAKVGQLTGAQILVTGKIFTVDHKLYLIGKIIGTETGRVYGETESIMEQDSVADATEKLADKIAQTITARGETLVAREEKSEDFMKKLAAVVAGKKLPTVSVAISERSITRTTIDPAAETELDLILSNLGFQIIDEKTGNSKPDVEVRGEAFNEFGMRRGNLVSSKGRVEIKVVDRASGQLLAVDREVATAVDLSEEISGKAAVQLATRRLAERIIPRIAK